MTTTVKQISIKQRISRWNLIRIQILIWCSLRNIQISSADIDMLVLLSIIGKIKLTHFCEELTKTELSNITKIVKSKEKEFKFIFNSLQSARNAVSKVSSLGLIKKEGKNKSNINIFINPEIELYIENNLLINYQFLSVDSNQS